LAYLYLGYLKIENKKTGYTKCSLFFSKRKLKN
jgi:hypothetical protein